MHIVEVATLGYQRFCPFLQQCLKIYQVVVTFGILLAKSNQVTQSTVWVQVQRCVVCALLLVVKRHEVALDVEPLV